MKCVECDYETNNEKSFSNHLRYGCKGYEKGKKCLYCGKLLVRKKPKEQGKFCNHLCYGLWRSENSIGKNAPSYKDGRCKERLLLRARLHFREWRRAVFLRDNYICQDCGDNKGGNLTAHHIKSFALFPMLRYDITNGITLCRKCHKKTDNYGYTRQNAKRN